MNKVKGIVNILTEEQSNKNAWSDSSCFREVVKELEVKADEYRDMDWQDMSQPLKLILLGSGILLVILVIILLHLPMGQWIFNQILNCF